MFLSKTAKCVVVKWLQAQFGALALIHVRSQWFCPLLFMCHRCKHHHNEKGKWYHYYYENSFDLLMPWKCLRHPHTLKTAILDHTKRQNLGICRWWLWIVASWKLLWNHVFYLPSLSTFRKKWTISHLKKPKASQLSVVMLGLVEERRC